ncbi:MAG: hypothetical protein JOY66_06715 [Acetobacteraceae bacterium]|nr:hypothetical protein [Acetobacteraceae bacterium]
MSAVGVRDARAGAAEGREGAAVAGEQVAALPGKETDHPLKIPDLLARLEQQIADGHVWTPPDDNAIDTFRSIVDLMSSAPLSDIRAVQALPSRFEARARAAEAAGRDEEAQRFLAWAQALAAEPGVSASQTADVARDSPEANAPREPPAREEAVAGTSPPTTVADTTRKRRDQEAPAASAPPPRSPSADGLQPMARPAAGPSLSPDMLALLLRRGEAMQRLGDISAARRLYGRAAVAGSARAATAMGKTFDPFYLGQIGARGVTPDPDSAAGWYRKAIAMGDPDAESRLRELGRGPATAPPPNARAATRSARARLLAVAPKPAKTVPEQCRAIIMKAGLGEDPTAAELSYLRQGCGPR